MPATEYQVTGMPCGHCEMSVRKVVGEIAGVTGIEVSAQIGRLIVTTDGQFDDAQIEPAARTLLHDLDRGADPGPHLPTSITTAPLDGETICGTGLPGDGATEHVQPDTQRVPRRERLT